MKFFRTCVEIYFLIAWQATVFSLKKVAGIQRDAEFIMGRSGMHSTSGGYHFHYSANRFKSSTVKSHSGVWMVVCISAVLYQGLIALLPGLMSICISCAGI